MKVQIDYFAVLRERRGLSSEQVETSARTATELYDELDTKHGLGLGKKLVRVSINEEFVPMDDRIAEGDRIVFIPPVAGG